MLTTPLGDLATLDLNNDSTQEQVLYYDKHQLLEGLVAEDVVDQVLNQMMQRQRNLSRLDVVSVVAAQKATTVKTVFVLDQGAPPEDLHNYVLQLRRGFSVRLVRYDNKSREFVTHNGEYTREIPLDKSLGEILRALEPNPRFPEIDTKIKDIIRQKQGFWGYLSGAYQTNIGMRLVLPRLFKNFAIQPYFDAGVWDIDRTFLGRSGQFYVIEVKHKFPFGLGKLKFGINRGSASALCKLSEAGFTCFHSIMVKPYWDDTHSVTYLSMSLKQGSESCSAAKSSRPRSCSPSFVNPLHAHHRKPVSQVPGG